MCASNAAPPTACMECWLEAPRNPRAPRLEFDDNKLCARAGRARMPSIWRASNRSWMSAIDSRGNLVSIDGDARERAAAILRALYARLEAGESVTLAEVDAEIRFTDDARATHPAPSRPPAAARCGRARRPRPPICDMMRDHPLVFGIGPAGTGKTYLAAAFAAHMLHEQAGGPDHPVAPGAGSGRAAGLSARRPEREDRSLSASAL